MRSRNNRGPAATIISAFRSGKPTAHPASTTRVTLLPGDEQPKDDHSDDCGAALRRRRIRRAQTRCRITRGGMTRFAAANSSITRRQSRRQLQVTASDIKRVRGGSRHFCASGTFCASSRHATNTDYGTRRQPASSISHNRTTPYAIHHRPIDRCRNAQMR